MPFRESLSRDGATVRCVASRGHFQRSPIEACARLPTIHFLVNTRRARQNWFPCSSPNGLVARVEAVNLIRKHAAGDSHRLGLSTDLTDAQIRNELPSAWLREHQQTDMFRDAAASRRI